MKNRILSVFLTLCMLLTLLPTMAAASTTTGNLIVNPGGETAGANYGMLKYNGWSEDTSPERGYSYVAASMNVTAQSGSMVMGFYCMGNPSITQSSCYQTFDVTSYTAGNTVSYTFSGRMTVSVQGTGSGTATLKIEQLDTNGNVVASDFRTSAQPGEALTSYTMTGTVASGVTRLRISIAADLNAQYDQNSDAFAAFDDLSLTLTTTPRPDFTVTGGTEGADYAYTDGVLTVKTATALTIANNDPTKATANRIEVTSANGANLTLSGVNIDVSGTSGAAAFKITPAAGAVNLTLADGSANTLKSGANCAGLQKDNTALLTIRGGTDGTGSLHAVGGSNGAGIGANPNNTNGSSMTIIGGSVITEGDVAGIGGGSDGAAAFNVAITGGNVSGTIGGGSACAPIDITVSGGSVNAVRTGETPTNGSGTAVQLYTLTIKNENDNPLADTAVTALTATPVLGYTYGMTDVKTDANGKLYVYLPAGKTAVSVTAGGVNYSGSVTDSAATLLPPQARWGTDDTCAAGGGTLTDAVTYANGLSDGTAYIQLLSDVKIASMLEFSSGKTTVLDLNGFDIDRGSTTENESSVLNVQGSLTLKDTSANAATAPGKITGGRFMHIGGVNVSVGGSLVMEGGSITGNTACGGSGGGGVCVGGSFTMTGGSITGNTCESGGGGGVFVSGGSFTMTGGSITGNNADLNGGGVYVSGGSLTLGGAAEITGNTRVAGSTSATDNIYLATGRTITISPALTNKMPIGVNMQTPGVFTSGSTVTNSSYLTNFISDSANFAVRAAAENQLELAALYAITKTAATNGSFTMKRNDSEASSAVQGDTVTVTPAADSGYAPSGISVSKTGDGSTAVTVTNGSFTMPAYPVTVTVTFKRVTAAPGAPVIGTGANHPTDTAITVSTYAGQEYYISTSADAPASWSGAGYFKAAENGTHTFTGLTPATKYYIHTRTAETDTAMPSESAKTQQYTQPTAPAASSVTIDYANETVSFAGTLEVYTAQIGGTPIISGGSISNHIPDAGSSAQTVCVRVKAVSGGAPESEWTAFAIPARPANGAALAVDTAAETVSVPAGYTYQTGSGSAVSVSADTAATLAPGAVLTCWKTATGSAFKSAEASVTAPARLDAVDSTTLTVNGIAESLTTTAGMQYSTDGGTAWTDCTADMALTAFGWDGTAEKSVQVRMKATTGESGKYASDSITVTIPARAAAPSAAATNETIFGKHDGAITGVTALMEYRKSGASSWTAVTGTAIADLEPGVYNVRIKATADAVYSNAKELTIAAGSKLTLTLDAQGGTAAGKIENIEWQKTVAPPAAARSGYTFGGWFTAAEGAGTQLTDATKIEADATYYAKWTANTYTVTFHANGAEAAGEMGVQSHTYDTALALTANAFVRTGYAFSGWNAAADGSGTAYADRQSVKNLLAEQNANLDLYAQWTENTRHNLTGTVTDDASPSAPVSGAAVALKQGETPIASTVTDADGQFLFTNLLPGSYNLVVTKDGKTVTMLCAIEKAGTTQTYTQNVTLPTAASNSSTLTVAKDEGVKELPRIVVGGLDELAETKDADIFMSVTQKAEDKSNAEQKTILVSAGGQNIEMYLEVTLKKNDDALTEADNVLEIVIPYDFSAKSNVNVWRCHNGSAEKFTSLKTMPTAPYADMTFFADTHNGLLYIFAGKFSTYAVSYTQIRGGAGGYPVAVDTAGVKNGNVSVSPASASAGTTIIVTVKPDAGCALDKLTVTDDSGNVLALTDNGNGTYSFTMPNSKASVSAVFIKSGSPFADVLKTAYYCEAVLWAAGKGIARGTGANIFSPDGICTRAQAVSFLWRAMGRPEPAAADCRFTDVDVNVDYCKAVIWATEQGIVRGTSKTTFSPGASVTRAQALTFLWRAAGSPAGRTEHPFADVPAQAYYADAALWAADGKIVRGTGPAAFSPDAFCTRAQIVTFLWRWLGK